MENEDLFKQFVIDTFYNPESKIHYVKMQIILVLACLTIGIAIIRKIKNGFKKTNK